MDTNGTLVRLGVVFVGAGTGGALRYWLGGLVQNWWSVHLSSWSSFPMGTMIVNVTGCLAIGFLFAAFTGPLLVREDVRLFLIIGLLGGYTTFSSFGRETLGLAQDGQWLFAGLNILLSNAVGLLAVFAGDRLALRLFGAGAA